MFKSSNCGKRNCSHKNWELNCKNKNKKICSGIISGICNCGECICNNNYEGKYCQFSKVK